MTIFDFLGFLAALCSVLYAAFRVAVFASRFMNPDIPDSQDGARFPLGSLASWRDLLRTNQNILDETSRSGPSRRAGTFGWLRGCYSFCTVWGCYSCRRVRGGGRLRFVDVLHLISAVY